MNNENTEALEYLADETGAPVEVLREYFDLIGDQPEVTSAVEYRGEWATFEDYAEDLLAEYDVPEYLQGYIDYEKFARELEWDYEVIEYGDMVHVFLAI